VGVGLTNDGQRTVVRVNAAGQVTYRVSRMQNPDRLVLDFTGARIGTGKTTIPSELAPVRAVRLGQFKPEIARVVIDLAGAAPYSVQRDGTAVVVVFASEETIPQVTTASDRDSEPARERAAEFKFNTVSHAVRPRRSALRQASSVPMPKIDLPAELTQPSAYFARLSGGRQAQNPPAPPTPDTGAAQQPTPTQPAPTQAAPPPPAPTQAPAPVTHSGEKYTGTPLSVNLKAVDLVDFFRLITEVSGLNVVIDPAVKGSLSIVLNDVPWDQALDIVLQNNGLDKQLNGNVLRIATKETLKREAETQFDLVRAQTKAVELVTATRVLSYAKAATLKDTLKKFSSERGDIISDDRSNTLIIHDIPSVIPALDNLIRQLDKKTLQVEIEARVVSATRSFARDIGTQFAFSTTSGKSVFGGALGASPIFRTVVPPFSSPALVFGTPPTSSGTGTPAPVNVQMPLVTNFGAQAPTSGVSYLFTSPNFALDYIITAAEAKGIGKLLSKPKVSTQNNEKATVKQGVKIPVQTVINNTITVQYVDAVLKLEVTPQITADGTIFMDVLVENTQIDNGIPRVQGIPALDTQSVESKILVNDGGTAVIGGVIVSNQQTNITEVPIIGSLPLIGHLFRRDNISNTSTELLFFLTPRIVPG